MIIETCVETLEEAVLAEKSGADRLELCSHLELDGLSPSIEIINKVVQAVDIPIKIMVRNKAGSFVYNDEDVKQMIEYCQRCIQYPIDGFVVGMLNSDFRPDIKNLARLLNRFPAYNFTFHKAIDLVDDPISEIKRCEHLKNLTHILTSGKKATAMEGTSLINKMVSALEPRFKIIAAGKITPSNIDQVRDATNATEFHGRNILNKKTLSR